MAFMSSGSRILRRTDGPDPVWKVLIDVAEFRRDSVNPDVGGIRGMTPIPGPSGPSNESLLFVWAPNTNVEARVLRTDFDKDGSVKAPAEETSLTALAREYLQTPCLGYTLAAYNNMPATKLGSVPCNLIGFEILAHPGAKVPINPGQQYKSGGGFWSGGGIICRVSSSNYFVTQVGGRGGVGQPLTGVRCFANSPFPSEPNAVYCGGYDCNFFPSEHTAWIYKATPT